LGIAWSFINTSEDCLRLLDCIYDLWLFDRIVMSNFDNWIMDHYEEMWEEQEEEDHGTS
tara:strand:+ start:234 stop:410 length:177 start_codon:yes stop_codon:yes gene_type:complete